MVTAMGHGVVAMMEVEILLLPKNPPFTRFNSILFFAARLIDGRSVGGSGGGGGGGGGGSSGQMAATEALEAAAVAVVTMTFQV